MKSALFSIFAGAMCAAMTASATDATAVRVSFNGKPSSVKIEKMPAPQTGSFPGVGMSAQPIVPWQIVNIPVEIEAKAGGDTAHFVSELTFKAHLLVEIPNGRAVLTKEITYVDIPLSGNGETTKTEMSVGVFIPPSTAVRLNEKGKGDLKGKLVGIALETTFNGKDKEPISEIFDNSVKKSLTGAWWSKYKDTGKYVACSIDETPYAAWAGTFYPAVRPAAAAGSSAPTGSYTPSTTPESTDTETPSTTDTPAADTEEPAADDSSSRKGGKKNKNKKNKKR